MKNLVSKAWGYLLEILFPGVCLRCKKHLESEEEKRTLLCSSCLDNIPIYEPVLYNPKFTLIAVTSYDNDAVREILHAFKYRRFRGAITPIKILIDKYLERVDLKKAVSGDFLILPIPLHRNRFRQRGFNQAEEIANILGEKLGVSVDSETLVRVKDTPHLTMLSGKDERKLSVRDSFEVTNKEKLKGKNIILVDDVYTSGATAEEVMKVLRRAGTSKIIVFVLAKAG
jgi:ComF family protein